MQIVINISDKQYNDIVEHYNTFPNEWKKWGLQAIKNGTPLPKGHGRLIDADYKVSSDGRTVNSVCGYMAPTIIEADRSEKE